MDASRSLLISFSLYVYDGEPENKHGLAKRKNTAENCGYVQLRTLRKRTVSDASWTRRVPYSPTE